MLWSNHVGSVLKPSAAFVTGIWLLGWVSCSVYDKDLLKGATGGGAGALGVGGTSGGSSGRGGTGGGATGGAGGAGGMVASAGDGGKGSGGAAGASGGGAGKGSGGAGGGGGGAGKGSGGSAGKGGGGVGGKGGTAGVDGGSAGTGVVGMAGEGGAGGCVMGDCCPDDDAKVDPGECGCGVPDTDSDSDGTPDCLDGCAADPAKTSPAMCGCGIAEASCLPLKNSLVHRYSFSGTGTTVTDTKGTAHGTVMGVGATLGGNGTLTLAGGYVPADMDPNKQYVELPAGCLDGLTDATFEAWVDWTPTDGTNAQSSWQRVFDLGETAGSGVGTYIFVSPRVTSTTGPSRASFTSSMGSSNQIYANGPVLAAGPRHFTVVVDDTNNLMLLYVDGALAGSVTFPGALSAINDTACYLGRSHFVADPYFAGILDEYRVHSRAFTAADVAFSHASGPNPGFL